MLAAYAWKSVFPSEPMREEEKMSEIQKTSWDRIEKEQLSDSLSRQAVYGEKATLGKFFVKRGSGVARHSHASEEYSWVTSGALKYSFDDREVVVNAGEILVVPPNVPHSIAVLEDAVFVDFFAPAREDWLRGEDQYLRG
jgi:quercetin dioxygenase-like cupin family protein